MRYPFMREFTGVPLQLGIRERVSVASLFVKTNMRILARYAAVDAVEVSRQAEGSGAMLHLYDRPGGELVAVSNILSAGGRLAHAAIALTGLSGGRAAGGHTYSVGEERSVYREDTPGLQADLAVSAGPPSLTRDLVSGKEVGGLQAYLLDMVDGGRYMPVDLQAALRLQGIE